MVAKSNTEDFIRKAKAVWGDRYSYPNTHYVGSKIDLLIECPIHGEFAMRPNNFLSKHGCIKCGLDTIKHKATIPWEKALEKMRTTHGDRYSYVESSYKGLKSKMTIICRTHGEFEQSAHNHSNGQGCPVCGRETQVMKQTDSLEEALKKFRKVHGDNKYDYSLVNYINNHEKVKIICQQHGIFEQTPNSHSSGQGCPQCRKNRPKDLDYVITAFRKTHGDLYLYDNVILSSTHDKVIIVCKKHGEFTQVAKHHINGSKCPKCASIVSKQETQLAEFIASLGIEATLNTRKVIPPKELDIYIPEKNLAIEFNGVYWHGDDTKPKTYHKEKTDACAAKGIRLIHILDTEWETRRPQIERMLRHALGVSTDAKVNARECKVVEVSHKDAQEFMEANHIQGKSGASKVRLGLEFAGELVAVMLFTKGGTLRGAARLSTDTVPWELSRYATSAMVRGGASKLLKAFRTMYPNEPIVSFSQNDWYSDSGIYNSLGFVQIGKAEPDYRVWHQNTGIRPKSHWQRRNIPKILELIGADTTFDPDTDPRTEWQVEDEVGAMRIWDTGRVKWLLE